jgi:hypothetical protein
MTLILDLPPGVEEALAREAARRGTTPESLALDGLRQLFPEADDMPKTGAELLAIMEREGLFLEPREGDPDSPELARRIRDDAWRRS